VLFSFSQVPLWGGPVWRFGRAQPCVQRTRLRRALTEAVSSQKTFANNASGQRRRAADALVGHKKAEAKAR